MGQERPSAVASTNACARRWISGADQEWSERTGRQPMTAGVIERPLRRYPGDM